MKQTHDEKTADRDMASKELASHAEANQKKANVEKANEAKAVESKRKDAPRRSKYLGLLFLVFAGMLAAAGLGYFFYDAKVLTGQLGAFAAAGGLVVLLPALILRSRGRISMRGLLILFAILSAILAWVGPGFFETRRETNAVDFYLSYGARATYGEGMRSSYYENEDGLRTPRWVLDIVGRSYFTSVDTLRLDNASINNSHLVRLSELRQLSELHVQNERITAKGIARMPIVPGLKSLGLYWHQVTPESVQNIKQFQELEALTIGSPYTITGAYQGQSLIFELSALPQIRSLNLTQLTSVSADEMEVLAKLPSLESLTLQGRGAAFNPSVSGLAVLAESQTIRDLTIRIGEFSDTELMALENLESLESLAFSSYGVTVDGVRAFHAARPNVKLNVFPDMPGLNIDELNSQQQNGND